MTRFERHLDAQQELHDVTHARVIAQRVMSQHLVDISGDSSGSRPEDHLGPSGVAVCEDFLVEAERLNWPNAQDLSLKKRRTFILPVEELPVWRKPTHYPPHPYSRALLHRKDWEGQGYRIGMGVLFPHDFMGPGYQPRINLVDLNRHKTAIMLCTDGLLRCHRVPAVFRKSYGYGYGRLPEGARIDIDGNNLPVTLSKYLLNKLP